MSDNSQDRTVNVAGKLLKSSSNAGFSFTKFVDSGAGVKVPIDAYSYIYSAITSKNLPCFFSAPQLRRHNQKTQLQNSQIQAVTGLTNILQQQ